MKKINLSGDAVFYLVILAGFAILAILKIFVIK